MMKTYVYGGKPLSNDLTSQTLSGSDSGCRRAAPTESQALTFDKVEPPEEAFDDVSHFDAGSPRRDV